MFNNFLKIYSLILCALYTTAIHSAQITPMDTSSDVDESVEAKELFEKLNTTYNWEDRKKIITALITKHQVDSNAIEWGGHTTRWHSKVFTERPLHAAIHNNDIVFTKFLIDKNANIHSQASMDDRFNYPPLYFAQTTEMAELLLSSKASVHENGTIDTRSLLHNLVEIDKNAPALITLYAQHNVDVCAVDENHHSPLRKLVYSSHPIAYQIEIMQKLIEVSVPIHTRERMPPFNNMTVMQILKVEKSPKNTQLLAAMKKTIQEKVFKEVHSILTQDTTGIVVTYYDDGEFDTEENICDLAAQVAKARKKIDAEKMRSIMILDGSLRGDAFF